MNMIEITSLTNETYIINLDQIAAIKADLDFSSSGTRYATISLSSGQLIHVSKADFDRVRCQLTNQYNIRVVAD